MQCWETNCLRQHRNTTSYFLLHEPSSYPHLFFFYLQCILAIAVHYLLMRKFTSIKKENLLSIKKKIYFYFFSFLHSSLSNNIFSLYKFLTYFFMYQGRFLLAAASGRVLARSFHKVVNVVFEVIEKALGTGDIKVPDTEPEMTWKRTEYSVMLKHVQAHVAPTDVDPGAGLQWLPEIVQNKKRTGALLERVFTPCQMYFRYTRHKGGLADLKVTCLSLLFFFWIVINPDIHCHLKFSEGNTLMIFYK